MGPGERFLNEYIGLQSTSEADDGREEGPSSFRTSVSLDHTQEHVVKDKLTLNSSTDFYTVIDPSE